MNKKAYQEMSNEELINAKKVTTIAAVLLTVMLLILLGMGIYISVTKKFSALVAIPFALSPTTIINFKNLKKINQELKTRGIS